MRDRLIRLGPSQLAILFVGLLMVIWVGWIVVAPDLANLYALEYGLPRLEARWGFTFGSIHYQRDGAEYDSHGIVSLQPDGRLARLGLRVHDVPFAFSYHGHGASLFYDALRAGDRGETLSIDVVNVDDWSAGRSVPARRTIGIRPR